MQKEIEVNKNFDDMNKNFISERKPYQIAAIGAAFLVGGAVMLILRPYLGTTVCSYISLVLVIPFGILGMYERHGIDFISYVKIKRQIKKYGKLHYDSNPVREVKEDEG